MTNLTPHVQSAFYDYQTCSPFADNHSCLLFPGRSAKSEPIPKREPGGVRFTREEARTQEGGNFSDFQPRSFGVAGKDARAQENGGFAVADYQSDGIGLASRTSGPKEGFTRAGD